MVIAVALSKALRLVSSGCLHLSEGLLDAGIPITLIDICTRMMQSQHEDGSWTGDPETNSYAALILATLVPIPYFQHVRTDLETRILRSKKYLLRVVGPTHTYCATAMVACSQPWDGKEPKWNDSLTAQTIRGLAKMFRSTKTVSDQPDCLISISLTAGHILSSSLWKKADPQFLSDKYKKYVFLTAAASTLSNYATGARLPLQTLETMIELVMHLQQLDNYIEGTVQKHYMSRLGEIKRIVADLTSLNNAHNKSCTYAAHDLAEVAASLRRYINMILDCAGMEKQSTVDKATMMRKMRVMIFSHCQQALDSVRLCGTEQSSPADAQQAQDSCFYDWATGLGAQTVSTDAFLYALLGASASTSSIETYYPTSDLRYLGEAFSRHLSSHARLLNDLASAERDRAEGNLNALDAPEFGGRAARDCTSELISMAIMERDCRDLVLDRILKCKSTPGTTTDVLCVMAKFVDVFLEVYMAKDIGVRLS
jgi:hypothetical protein